MDKPYKIATFLLISAFALLGISRIGDYGMGWDEMTRWNSGDRKLAYYEHLLSGKPGEMERAMSGDRYPGLFDLPLALWHQTFGGDRMLQGHLFSLFFGVLGLAGTAWLARTAFGWRTAFLAVLFLLLYGNFYGHAMINPKDIPFMATYTLGLAAILKGTHRLLKDGHLSLRYYLLAGALVGLAGASRIPGLVLLGLAAVSLLAALIVNNHHQSRPRLAGLTRLAIGGLVMGITAFLIVLLFFPRLHFQLFSGVGNVVGTLHSSAAEIPLLYKGQLLSAGEAPRTYAHWMFLITTPLWILFLIGAGVIFAVRTCRTASAVNRAACISFLLLAAFPWAYVFLSEPDLHNGIRHMLWAIPPLFVLAGYGAVRFLDLMGNSGPRLKTAGVVVLTLFVAAEIMNLYRLHPYQYVSFNVLAGNRETVINRYEGEYWFTSNRHMLEAMPDVARSDGLTPDPESPVKLRVSGPLDPVRPFLPEGFQLVDQFADADYYLSNTTFRSDLLAEGEVVYEIKRGGIPIARIKRLDPH